MIIAEGDLDWLMTELTSERYGSVVIRTTESLLPFLAYANFPDAPVGRTGRLVAEVVVVRYSVDGVVLPRPSVGERIVLGEGSLFTEEHDGVTSIGLRPLDGRLKYWLDYKGLKRSQHHQVRLVFQELPMTEEDATRDAIEASTSTTSRSPS